MTWLLACCGLPLLSIFTACNVPTSDQASGPVSLTAPVAIATSGPTLAPSDTPPPTQTETQMPATPTTLTIPINPTRMEAGDHSFECSAAALYSYMGMMADTGRYDEGVAQVMGACDDPDLLRRGGTLAEVVQQLRAEEKGPSYLFFEDEEPAEVGAWRVYIVQDGERLTDQEVTLLNRPFEIEVEMEYPHSIIWSAEPYGESWFYNEVGVSITNPVPIVGFNTLWSLNTMVIDPPQMTYLCRCLQMQWLVTHLLMAEDWYRIKSTPAPDQESSRYLFSLPVDQINGRELGDLDGLHLYLQFFIDQNRDQVIDAGELQKIAITIDDPTAELNKNVEALAWNADVAAGILDDGTVELTRFGDEPVLYDTPISESGEVGWQQFPYDIRLLNMDEDDEIEVVAVLSTRGASCCTTLTLFDFVPEAGLYLQTDAIYRKYTLGFRFGPKEPPIFGPYVVWTLNEDFHTALGGASVSSFMSPLQILSLDNGELVDVTAQFPAEIERHLPTYFLDGKNLECIPFAVGGYLAEMALLGRYDEGLDQAQIMCAEWLQADEWVLIYESLGRHGYLDD